MRVAAQPAVASSEAATTTWAVRRGLGTSAGRARGLASRMTSGELLEDVPQPDAPRPQQHHRVEPEIGHLLHQAPVAFAPERGRDDLGGLLADLPAHGGLALGEQSRHVRTRRPRLLACGHDAFETLEHPRRGRLVLDPIDPAGGQAREEAGTVPRVTGDPFLVHLDEQRVGVTIGIDGLDVLDVAGGLALAPERLPRARPEVRLPGSKRRLQGGSIHPGHHEDLAGIRFLHDRGNQALPVEDDGVSVHTCSRTSTPWARRKVLASAMVCRPKWKMEAASAASAPPSISPSRRCSRDPAPPDAMTGTVTASATARVSSRSYPSLVPSRSMLVRRISPAPRSTASQAQATASRPAGRRPPCVYTDQLLGVACVDPDVAAPEGGRAETDGRGSRRRASMATTMHWLPNRSADSRMIDGLARAAVLRDTLSAPARSRTRTSSTPRTPPPTVSGM